MHYFPVLLLVEFRTGKSPILLATDVASRGLGKSTVRKLTGVLIGCLVAEMCGILCIIMMMLCPFNSAGMSHSFCGGHAVTLQWLRVESTPPAISSVLSLM